MKLSVASKERLLTTASHVYRGYVALDFFKSRSFNTEFDGEKSLFQLCQDAIDKNELEQQVMIAGKVFLLKLTPSGQDKFEVIFQRPMHEQTVLTKKIIEYTDNEALDLLANQQFHLELSAEEDVIVSNRLDEDNVIGGAGKIDLYRTHLVTLYNIIAKIQTEEDITNLLVALATGSGKTYVQALWMYILSLSKNTGIFAVPDKLTNQLYRDIARLLPNSFMSQISLLREKQESPEAEAILANLGVTAAEGKIVIASSERLLDKHYQHLLNADEEQVFLSFDEQHLSMQTEVRRVRLIELSKKLLSMFLTATPNLETYQLAGNKPVAIMSSGQKQQAGQGQFPVLFTNPSRNVSDKNKLTNFRFWQAAFWQTILNKILLHFTNAIQEEQSSAAVSLVEDLPFYLYRKPEEYELRWQLQVPAARKILCIVDDNEALVNFCRALTRNSSDIYHNGNVVDRSDVGAFFQIPDMDREIISMDRERKRSRYLDSLSADERDVIFGLANKSMAEQLKDNIFHNLVEYVLMDLTGLDEIEHNRLRKQNLPAFIELIKQRFHAQDANYFARKLAQEIDSQGALEVSRLLAELSRFLEFTIAQSHISEEILTRFVDNWALDEGLCQHVRTRSWNFSSGFDYYASQHLVIGVMTGMENAETPINESKPFLGIAEDRYPLYTNDGILVEKAKKRQRTTLEILNDRSYESSFAPNYMDVTEEVCDNYFRLGFVGVYVSNKKTEGFSDRNLHTVVNIAEHSLSNNNSPETLIQGIGRNRGLDETVVPAYIHALGRKQKAMFDLQNLDSDDYYPELFKAQKKYNSDYLTILGDTVSKQMIAWFYANLDKDETIDHDQLKRQILKYIAQALRNLNNKNSHNIQLSRSQLTQVIARAMKSVDEELTQIKKPYRLSLFVRVLGSILNFMCECYYTVKRVVPTVKLYYHWLFTSRQSDDPVTSEADQLYMKIIRKTSFKRLIEKTMVASEFKNWITRVSNGVESSLRKNPEPYLKGDIVETLHAQLHNSLFPLLAKMVIPERTVMVTDSLNNLSHVIEFLNVNRELIGQIFDSQNENPVEQTLQLLRKVPGLEQLSVSDVVNYPKQVSEKLAVMQRGPLQVITNSVVLKHNLAHDLAHYLQHDFLTHLSTFVTYPDFLQIREALLTGDNAYGFAQHFITLMSNDENEISAETVFSELKEFLQLTTVERLDTKAVTVGQEFGAIQTAISSNPNPLANLNDNTLNELAEIIQTQFLPSIVNLFPLETRESLLNQATREKIKYLLISDGQELMKRVTVSDPTLPLFIFRKLSDFPLPSIINPKAEEQKARDFFASKLKSIYGGHAISHLFTLAVGKIGFKRALPKYEVDIKALLLSDEFFDTISPMLPFDQWQQLKVKFNENPDSVLEIAKTLNTMCLQGEGESFTPALLLELINTSLNTQFQDTTTSLEVAQQSFADFSARVTDNPDVLHEEIKTKLVKVTREFIILLAAFIKSDEKKQEFLSREYTQDQLFQFFVLNKEAFSELSRKTAEERPLIVLTLLNQLLPAETPFELDDLIDSELNAKEHADQCMADFKLMTVVTFLSSDELKDLLADSFNPEDYELLSQYLNEKDNVIKFAHILLDGGMNSLDKESLLTALRTCDERLVSIKPIDERMADLSTFLTDMQDEKNIDKNMLSELLTESFSSILFHPRFVKTINDLMGFLNESELTFILQEKGVAEPAQEAARLTQFLELLKNQDKEGLRSQFMTLNDNEAIGFENLPAKQALDHLTKIIEDIVDCHCYYNQHDKKGAQWRGGQPAILEKVSAHLKTIQVDASSSFFSAFSRKLFFIQAVRNGLPQAGEISAASNEQRIKILERIKTHILRPLWWSTNVSRISYAFVKGCGYIADRIKDAAFALINGFKFIANFIIRTPYFKLSTRNQVSVDYNDTTFDYANEINNLTPFERENVAKEDCPVDVVTNLEKFIQHRPKLGSRFFARAIEAEDSIEAENPVLGIS